MTLIPTILATITIVMFLLHVTVTLYRASKLAKETGCNIQTVLVKLNERQDGKIAAILVMGVVTVLATCVIGWIGLLN